MASPSRGEVWSAKLDPARGHEQAGARPVSIVSANGFNRGASGLVIVVPLTTRGRGIPGHVAVGPRAASVVRVSP